jgi:hypothetical protein
MEWYNIGYCTPIAHDLGVHKTLDHTEKTLQGGVAFAQTTETFEDAAKAVMEETPKHCRHVFEDG